MPTELNWAVDENALSAAVAVANASGKATYTLNAEHAFAISGPTTFEKELERITGFAASYPREKVETIRLTGTIV